MITVDCIFSATDAVWKVDLVLPQWIYDIVWDQIKERIGAVRFSRVIMPLSALLEDQFFNSYIKSGTF